MELQISAIKNGTVIDHLPTDTALKVVEILDLKNFRETVTVAFNLTSNSLGKKGIVKCNNSRCITNSEKVETKFLNESDSHGRKYRCIYCEKVIKYTDIILK